MLDRCDLSSTPVEGRAETEWEGTAVILAVVIACEIGFWVLILLGLLARYPLGRRRLGLVLLASTPVVDLVLLVATALDLASGATANLAHAVAAVYLGFSIGYGHKLIAWADARFAHRFAGGPAPVKRYGAAYTAECWRDVLRTAVAVGVSAAVLWALIAVTGDPERSAALEGGFGILGIVAAIEVLWAVSYTIWPRRAPVAAA